MRKIHSDIIKDCIKRLILKANYYIGDDIKEGLEKYKKIEVSEIGRDILGSLLNNAELARQNEIAICQDTGMCVVFVELGQDVHIEGECITDVINNAVKEAYSEDYLRFSVVADPLQRRNTGDNTPAIIYFDIISGDKVKIHIMPKGFGSENMSAIKMLKPSDGVEGVIDFVVDTVKIAGPNPCPPIVVGVGIGGTMEKAAILSKTALLRPINIKNEDEFYSKLEDELLYRINNLGIGPQGLGGITTAIGVNIMTYPTHIAGLPVAVNISCHATRHASEII